MKKITLFLFFLPFFVYAEEVSVVRVIDGDTVIIAINNAEERLRIVGIDTPETVKSNTPVECFGTESSNKAKDLLNDQTITVYLQAERDQYDRLLGYVDIAGSDFGLEMIKSGYAYAFRSFDHDRLDEYIRAEQLARNSKIGLWAENACVNQNTKAAQIVYEEKISFWQNIFKSIQQLFAFL